MVVETATASCPAEQHMAMNVGSAGAKFLTMGRSKRKFESMVHHGGRGLCDRGIGHGLAHAVRARLPVQRARP